MPAHRRPWALLLALPLTVGAAPPPGERVELPVRLVTLSDGTVRFGVPVRIAGREVEAGLDTGSTGLRVMARALPSDVPARGEGVHYFYGVGTQLDGREVELPVAFGEGAGVAIRLQRVNALSCRSDKPRCPAAHADPVTFGIQGNGLPHEGFAAILGVNLRADRQPNPFEATGTRRWIVELPVPGGAATGRIILNPSIEETADYRLVRFAGDDNSMPGCIAGANPLGTTCGAATIDSGAPGLRVVQPGGHPPVPPGTDATIAVGAGKTIVSWRISTERREQGSHLTFEQRADAPATRLFLGVAPYYAFSILYDADAHTIGFKPR